MCFHLVVWSVTGYHQQAHSCRQDAVGILAQLFQGIAAIVCNFQSETIKQIIIVTCSPMCMQGDNTLYNYCKQMLPVMLPQLHKSVQLGVFMCIAMHVSCWSLPVVISLARCYVKLYDIIQFHDKKIHN